jgi:hypothetical protein
MFKPDLSDSYTEPVRQVCLTGDHILGQVKKLTCHNNFIFYLIIS